LRGGHIFTGAEERGFGNLSRVVPPGVSTVWSLDRGEDTYTVPVMNLDGLLLPLLLAGSSITLVVNLIVRFREDREAARTEGSTATQDTAGGSE
jgi:hypothetical protein